MRYAIQQASKEEARLKRIEQRRAVEEWMSLHEKTVGRKPTLRETGEAFDKSGTWVMILLRMKEQDEGRP